jgi:hypothetical protein
MPTYKIAIPEACTEKWEEMRPTGCGAFCSSCQKEVIDFTNKPYTEIAKIIHQSNGHLCGRLTPAQMQVEYEYQPLIINNNWFRKGLVGAGLTLLVAATQVSGQTVLPKTKTEKVELANTGIDLYKSNHVNEKPEKIIITGTIKNAENEPAIGALITLKGNKSIGAAADFDGRFMLEIPGIAVGKNAELTVQLLGYYSIDVSINPNMALQNIDIKLELESKSLGYLGMIYFETKADRAKAQADRFYFGVR